MPDTLTAVYEIAFIVFGTVGGLWAVGSLIARRIERRLDKQDNDIKEIRTIAADLRSELDRQMGGNSNGLRQELNQQGQRLAAVEGHLGLRSDA